MKGCCRIIHVHLPFAELAAGSIQLGYAGTVFSRASNSRLSNSLSLPGYFRAALVL